MKFEELDQLSKYELVGSVNRNILHELAQLKLTIAELEETCIARFGFDGQYHPDSAYGVDEAARFAPDREHDARRPIPGSWSSKGKGKGKGKDKSKSKKSKDKSKKKSRS
ncbi:uncharacterized protein AMSG_09441 [Thecamonas trahens ATCC 50062]|uniref:Uncharacterized protein n=1 Tax=Thecamonas trahens ATCC 50062 TaxID=461836 RepID=A0A0L0DN44_THETB|nr:hypothetical protein AMSG_09441 [Thecamonas trahens ATCC 50062]KNC53729.1 hypothetical protein AMSG_09441 [Thecamonas trahens ATCC 50062]|eukprot:XP_013754293.1 hypothetical protein AMSG_09441 [Thecamonas trahens ATCC 50062]